MKKLLMAVLMVLFASVSYGAESCVQSLQTGGNVNVLQMAWTTDGSGNFTATDTGYPIDAYLMMVETDPDGTAVPTAAYDITLKNANGVDVMGGALSNRSATATEITLPLLNGNYTMIPVVGPLTFDVTSAGNDKKGVVRIYFVR